MSIQASAPAEPHAGLLPAGEPAQHGVSVHTHLRDLRAGEGRGRLPLHGLRLARDLRLLGRGKGGEGERDVFRCWEGGERGTLDELREVNVVRADQKPPNSMFLSTFVALQAQVAATRQSVYM